MSSKDVKTDSSVTVEPTSEVKVEPQPSLETTKVETEVGASSKENGVTTESTIVEPNITPYVICTKPDSPTTPTNITSNHNNETPADTTTREISLRSEQSINDANEDSGSEISSVVNNASIISQPPDRYGFLGGDQYTHERYFVNVENV